MNYNARKRLNKSCKIAKEELLKYKKLGYRIIYCDETMITKSTIQQREFTKPYERV